MKAYLAKGRLLKFTLKEDRSNAGGVNSIPGQEEGEVRTPLVGKAELHLSQYDVKNYDQATPHLDRAAYMILKEAFVRNGFPATRFRSRKLNLTLRNTKCPESVKDFLALVLEGEVLGEISRRAALLGYDADVRVDLEITSPFTKTVSATLPVKHDDVYVLTDPRNEVSALDMPMTLSARESFCEGVLEFPPVWLLPWLVVPTDGSECFYHALINIVMTVKGEGNLPVSEGEQEEEIDGELHEE